MRAVHLVGHRAPRGVGGARPRAAAAPRLPAIPPVSRTGTGPTRSTTRGTNGSVDRPSGHPGPGFHALGHDDIGAQGRGRTPNKLVNGMV
ncbi:MULTISPECIES: hypothetical protein [unclassified Streptomyces]|uniref:hypothetical protein n=1 Tax=unclassified Streptomyces TaxID=2593676 RepID=UPI002254E538|nr:MULTISPECIES: hypothetical protein [unclassified Streptomyces]